MPVERLSRGFRDISFSFKANPLTNDLLAISNETAISRSVRNLVLTYLGERPFNHLLGSRISRSLFENMDEATASIIEEEVETVIQNYEPRVVLQRVSVSPDFDNNEFNISIFYKIVGIDVADQQLSFALTSTR